MHIMTVKAKKNTANIITALVFIAFIFAGFNKLMRSEEAVEGFKQYGLNEGIVILIGFLEVFGALGLLLPKIRIWAAAGLSAIMTGAIVINIYHDEADMIAAPAVFFVLLIFLITLRTKINNLKKR